MLLLRRILDCIMLQKRGSDWRNLNKICRVVRDIASVLILWLCNDGDIWGSWVGEGNRRTMCTTFTSFLVNLKLFQVLKNETKSCLVIPGNGISYAAFK